MSNFDLRIKVKNHNRQASSKGPQKVINNINYSDYNPKYGGNMLNQSMKNSSNDNISLQSKNQ